MRLTWAALAFVPSALLVAVTSHISTDIAAAPFLWVIPLALYLATFVLTFRAGGDGVHRAVIRVAALCGGAAGDRADVGRASVLGRRHPARPRLLRVSAMICHRELYLRRPDVSRLTEFYMWISVGGVAGGIASGLIAPAVFPDVWEYPILIVIALLCRPGAFGDMQAVHRIGALLAVAVDRPPGPTHCFWRNAARECEAHLDGGTGRARCRHHAAGGPCGTHCSSQRFRADHDIRLSNRAWS